MSKQTIAVVLGAVVLFVVAVVGAMAFTSNDSSGGNIHTMSNGQMMTGPMDTLSDGEQMPGMTHP